MTVDMDTCGAKTRGGGSCGQRAGWGTSHVGIGRCKLHGGKTPIKTGRYSLVHRQSLAAKAQKFLDDPAPSELGSELALMRALLQDYLERYADGVKMPAAEIERVFGMIETITKLVERATKILNTTALTQAEVMLMQTKIVDLLIKYVPNPDDRIKFVDELQQSIGAAGGDSQRDIYIDG